MRKNSLTKQMHADPFSHRLQFYTYFKGTLHLKIIPNKKWNEYQLTVAEAFQSVQEQNESKGKRKPSAHCKTQLE